MHLKLITCELLEREVQALALRSPNEIEIELLPCTPQLTARELRRSIQNRINHSARGQFQAVLLACGGAQEELAGLRARSVPLVLPRVHDCLSLLFDRTPKELPRVPLKEKNGLQTAPTSYQTQSCSSDETPPAEQPTYWMAPVAEAAAHSKRPVRALPKRWDWRARFGGAIPGVAKQPEAPPDFWISEHGRVPRRLATALAKRPASLLEFLVDGYWSYDDFLVVPPGWRVGQNKGVLVAQESLS